MLKQLCIESFFITKPVHQNVSNIKPKQDPSGSSDRRVAFWSVSRCFVGLVTARFLNSGGKVRPPHLRRCSSRWRAEDKVLQSGVRCCCSSLFLPHGRCYEDESKGPLQLLISALQHYSQSCATVFVYEHKSCYFVFGLRVELYKCKSSGRK